MTSRKVILGKKAHDEAMAKIESWKNGENKYTDAELWKLDEATAFTDPENEEKMDAAIKEVVKGKTLLVIAHKLPSVMNANQICVMQEGKVEAIGTHDVLLNQSAEYRKLWQVAMDSAEWKVGKGA